VAIQQITRLNKERPSGTLRGRFSLGDFPLPLMPNSQAPLSGVQYTHISFLFSVVTLALIVVAFIMVVVVSVLIRVFTMVVGIVAVIMPMAVVIMRVAVSVPTSSAMARVLMAASHIIHLINGQLTHGGYSS
jgi:hypothetical protein